MATRSDAYYDVHPRILRVGARNTVAVLPLYEHAALPPQGELTVSVLAMEGRSGAGALPVEVTRSSSGGRRGLKVSFTPPGEQECVLVLEGRQPAGFLAEFRLYALQGDLFGLRPYRGDLHLHTCRSDGKESPPFVAAACRQIGMDFIAITDHGRYEPSLEAIAAFSGTQADLLILPGEEIHPPESSVHLLNVGGRFSINALFSGQEYRPEVASIEEQLGDSVAPANRYRVASCLWCHRAIQKAGGLSVFCHPYWVSGRRYDVPAELTEALLALRPFDALELIGGYHRWELESNALQVARYREECGRGGPLPIVGVSDSHGCVQSELFGWYHTIAFSEGLQFEALARAIRSCRSVAVEAVPGEAVRAHGPFRLVKYAQFLVREIFPRHDEICAAEGKAMLELVAGSAAARADLERLSGGVRRYYARVFGAP